VAEWNVLTNDANIKLMSETLKISPITAHVLANRNIRSKSSAVRFLNPSLEYSDGAASMKDVEKASKIIAKAKQKNVKTVIYGDYDVDGVMSTVILYKTLQRFGIDVSFYIPHREEEGYGLNASAIEKISADGCKLIIACDNGISSFKEIELAKELGMAVIVMDHHEPGFTELDGEDIEAIDHVPDAAAIIDPKQKECKYSFKDLCAAGVCYKFAEYFYSAVGMEFYERSEFLVLACIATYCDMVGMTGENRILAKNGLKLLNSDNYSNIGVKALIKERELEVGKIDAYEIGYRIGPCINASGRISHAKDAVELFIETDPKAAKKLAERLGELNEERKTMTGDACEAAIEAADLNEKIVILFSPKIHESIIGIVAGKVKDALNKPVIVLSKSGEFIKGSARSIESYDIYKGLYKCRDLFERFGGHSMAAGLTMVEENIDELRKRLNDECVLEETDFVKIINIEKELESEEITFALAKELEMLEPFGKDNPDPIFCSRGVFTDQIDIIGSNKKTLRFTFGVDGVRKIKAVCFNKLDDFMESLRKSYSDKICAGFLSGDIKRLTVKMDIAYNIDVNEYKGNVSVQIRIVDFKF